MSATTVTTTTAVVVGLQKMASHAGKTVGLVLHMLDRLSILGHVQFADLLGKDLDRLAKLVGLGLGRSRWWRSRLDGFRIRLVLMNLVGLGCLGFRNLLGRGRLGWLLRLRLRGLLVLGLGLRSGLVVARSLVLVVVVGWGSSAKDSRIIGHLGTNRRLGRSWRLAHMQILDV